MSKRFLYSPKERPSRLLRISSLLFAAGTAVLWIFGRDFGLSTGDLLIMTGFALFLITFSVNGRRAEKKSRELDKAVMKLRDECGKGDYNNDIFYDGSK